MEKGIVPMKQVSSNLLRGPNGFHFMSIQNTNKKWPLKLISACFVTLFCLADNTVPENWHICVLCRSYLLAYLLNNSSFAKLYTFLALFDFTIWQENLKTGIFF